PCASSRARCCWKSRGGSPVRAAARGLSLTSSIPVPPDGCCGQPTTCAAEEATTVGPPKPGASMSPTSTVDHQHRSELKDNARREETNCLSMTDYDRARLVLLPLSDRASKPR